MVFCQRYLQILLIGFCVLAINYVLYSAHKIVHYMTPLHNKTARSEHKDCISYINETQEYMNSIAEISKNERYHWHESHQYYKESTIMEICMVVGSLCGGTLCDLFGVKSVVLYSLFVGSVTSLMIPTVMSINFDIINFYIMLAAIATARGFQDASAVVMVAHWAPIEERTTLLCLGFGFSHFPRALGDVISFKLMKINNNRNTPVYVSGVFGLVMWVIWALFGYSSYRDCPYVTKQEYLYLESEQYGSVTYGRKPIPVSRMFKSLPFWALLASSIAHVFFWGGLKSAFGAFLLRAYGYEIMNNPWYSPVAWVVVFFGSILVALLTDIVIFTEVVQVTTMRKLLTIFGVMGPSIFFIAATYNDCNINMALAMVLLGGFFGSFYYPGSLANVLDIAPNYAGFINGCHRLTRLPANIALSTYSTFTHLNSSQKYRNLFWYVLALKIIAMVPFMLFGSGEEQPWNRCTNVNQKKEPSKSPNESDDDISL